jgi:hypothetical protein
MEGVMAIISFGAKHWPRSIYRYEARPRVVSFYPACCGGTRVGGALTLEHEGLPRILRVSMTWDALDRLRSELNRHGANPGDAEIVRRVLTHWGSEEYLRRLDRRQPLPAEGLVLSLIVGPASREPRRLLAEAGLLLPPAA